MWMHNTWQSESEHLLGNVKSDVASEKGWHWVDLGRVGRLWSHPPRNHLVISNIEWPGLLWNP